MTKIYKVMVMNRFDNDHTTDHFFTTKEKAENYAAAVNAKYEAAEKVREYGKMIYHVDLDWGIKEINADEDF